MVKTGVYRHFKGGLYQVICEAPARDKDSEEGVVIYYPLYGDCEIGIRSVENFTERVIRDGYDGPRFVLVEQSRVVISPFGLREQQEISIVIG